MTQEYWHESQMKRESRPTKPTHTPMPAVAGDLYLDMTRYLWSRDLLDIVAEDNGWYPSYNAGDAHPRIVIPATNTLKYNYWQARQFGDSPHYFAASWKFIRYQSPIGVPRLDSIIVCRPHAHLGGVVKNHLVITEGPFCALAAACEGFMGIATMGNRPTVDTIQHLVKYTKRHHTVTIMADRDDVPAGYSLAAQLARHGVVAKVREPRGTTCPAWSSTAHINALALGVPPKDLCDVPREHRTEAILGKV